MKLGTRWLFIGGLVLLQISNCENLEKKADVEETLLTNSTSLLETPRFSRNPVENDPFPIPISLEDFGKLQNLEISSDFPTPKPLPMTELPLTKNTEKTANFSATTTAPLNRLKANNLKVKISPISTRTTHLTSTTEHICPPNEKWYRCQPCDLCTQFFDKVCAKECIPGCGCQRFFRRKNGICIRVESCGFKKRILQQQEIATKKEMEILKTTTTTSTPKIKSLPQSALKTKKSFENQKNLNRIVEISKQIQHTTPMPRTKIFEISRKSLSTIQPTSTTTSQNRFRGPNPTFHVETNEGKTTKRPTIPKNFEIPKKRLNHTETRQFLHQKLSNLNRYFVEKTEGQIRFLLLRPMKQTRVGKVEISRKIDKNLFQVEKNTINKREKEPKEQNFQKNRHDSAIRKPILSKKTENLNTRFLRRKFSTINHHISTKTASQQRNFSKFSRNSLHSTTRTPPKPRNFETHRSNFPSTTTLVPKMSRKPFETTRNFVTHRFSNRNPTISTKIQKKLVENSLNPQNFRRRSKILRRTRKLIVRNRN